MQKLKMLTQKFIHELYLVIQGSIHAYLAVTEKVPEEKKGTAWDEYNTAFDEHIVPQLLEVLERNRCGTAELCHASLKLLEISARAVESMQTGEDTAKSTRSAEDGNVLSWFISVH
ncbi:MAG: hypothetical protein AB1500_07590 [Bacillota bacterium]